MRAETTLQPMANTTTQSVVNRCCAELMPCKIQPSSTNCECNTQAKVIAERQKQRDSDLDHCTDHLFRDKLILATYDALSLVIATHET